MGVVYRAEDTELRRTVALKFLFERAGGDPEAHERLRREARAASSLNDPNICGIYEVGEESGEGFIVMEYVEGKPLSKLIRPGGLPVETIIRYGQQISSALEHAHDCGVIHRDLKPLNVIVTPGGDAKILDFGLARKGDPADFDKQTLETVSTQTSAGLAGTMPYMAPEQFEGGGASPRTDLWSLGVVLYELTSGTRPFQGDNLYRLCTEILRNAPPALPPHSPPWQAREANAAEVPEARSAGSLCKAGTDYPLGMGASRRASHRARPRATIGRCGVKHLLPQIAPEPCTASFLPSLRSFGSKLSPAFVYQNPPDRPSAPSRSPESLRRPLASRSHSAASNRGESRHNRAHVQGRKRFAVRSE